MAKPTKYSDYKDNYEKLYNAAVEDFKLTINLSYKVYDTYYEYRRLINIDKNQNWRGRYYALMHELGHHLVAKDPQYRQDYYPLGLKRFPSIMSKKALTSKILEELEAWKFGRLYAENLGLKIDKTYFGELMSDCVTSYMISGIKSLYGRIEY